MNGIRVSGLNPNTVPNRKTPAGALSSPSFLMGPGNLFALMRPRPHASPDRPTRTSIVDPDLRHGEPWLSRSKSASFPAGDDHESVVTTTHCRTLSFSRRP